MRILALLTLLLTFAVAQYAPPPSPSSLCAVGSHRCDFNALQTCTFGGVWSTIKACPSTSYCFAQNDSGACHPLLVDNAAQCSTADTHRCANNTLQACSEHGYWTTRKECTETAYCFAQTTAAGKGDCHSLIASGEAGQCATLNAMQCLTTANGTSIQACRKKGYWETVEQCSGTERCLPSDEQGGVKCVPHADIYVVESHGTLPSSAKIKRTASMTTHVKSPTAAAVVRSTTCKPNSLACDKHRRFLFTCAQDGTWPTSPLQCFGPGYCRAELSKPLMCAGFPQYDGNNGKCNTHCESMDYLYCIGLGRLQGLRSM
ncbi:hypothetical protein BDU57DRAFT_531984 [Ampelomyces quisqualis]|uniref:Uncharacterized protein n=1 Tax=Ampelomyces quisqualis TaxID=50730 RepID=A0A6A5QBV2_AMPQU|nr:hypothetical protein BDU57DRAFT_531984 [Ampelomyces quisqualis]